jgi:hypothetical protein
MRGYAIFTFFAALSLHIVSDWTASISMLKPHGAVDEMPLPILYSAVSLTSFPAVTCSHQQNNDNSSSSISSYSSFVGGEHQCKYVQQ